MRLGRKSRSIRLNGRAVAALAAAILALALAGRVGAQGLAAGTVRLLSKNATLVDPSSGDAFITITPAESAKFLIVGPVKLQADFRVNLVPGPTEGPPVLLEVTAGGKVLRRFKVTPKAGSPDWQGRTDVKASAPVGFYVEVDPGPHAYEFKVSGAAQGAALYLVPASKARMPLAESAPVVPAKPPVVAVATPTPGGTGDVARATPVPTPAKSIDQIDTKGGQRADARLNRLAFEVGLKAGYAIPGDTAFSGAPTTGAEVRWSLGSGRTFAIGLEASAMGFGGIVPNDPNRASGPAAINVALTPVMIHATYWLPLDGRLRPYVAAGPGFVYGRSSYAEYSRTIEEAQIGPAAEALLGMQFDLSPTEFREGKQKLFAEVKSSYMALDFAAHDYDTWTATSVLVGAEIKF